MESNNSINIDHVQKEQVKTSNKFMAMTFGWMFLALTLSAVFAILFSSVDSLIASLYTLDEVAQTARLNTFGWVVMFAPLAFVLAMSLGYKRFSFPVLLVLFILYSAVNGMSLSFIFFYYSLGSITTIFFASAGLFGIMALIGATTKTDLTKFGSLMMMGLVGIIIASVINIFLKSSGMSYIISFIGVLVFVGLTAYDMQKLKKYSLQADGSQESAKVSLLGALELYLDFINIFLHLLRLFGSRD